MQPAMHDTPVMWACMSQVRSHLHLRMASILALETVLDTDQDTSVVMVSNIGMSCSDTTASLGEATPSWWALFAARLVYLVYLVGTCRGGMQMILCCQSNGGTRSLCHACAAHHALWQVESTINICCLSLQAMPPR